MRRDKDALLRNAKIEYKLHTGREWDSDNGYQQVLDRYNISAVNRPELRAMFLAGKIMVLEDD